MVKSVLRRKEKKTESIVRTTVDFSEIDVQVCLTWVLQEKKYHKRYNYHIKILNMAPTPSPSFKNPDYKYNTHSCECLILDQDLLPNYL